jgi:hypothetical protein
MPSDTDEEKMYGKNCPNCSRKYGLRQIVYGLPAGPPDPAVYQLGGCCISDNDPEVACIECGWKGSSIELENFE